MNALRQDSICKCIADAWAKSAVAFVISNGINITTGQLEGRDLDVFVEDKDYEKIIAVTRTALESLSYNVGIHRKSHTAWMFAFGPSGEVFEVDFFHYQQWHYFRFISSPKELKDAISLSGLKFSPFAWLVKNVLIQLLAKNFKKVESKIPEIETLVKIYPAALECCTHLFGSQVSERLKDISSDPTPKKMEELSSDLRKSCFSLAAKQPSRWPQAFTSSLRWAQKILEHKLICRQMCPVMALVGVDGSGKSTVIHSLNSALPAAFPFWRVINRHWRPEFLPLLSSFSSNPPAIRPGEAVIPRSKAGKLGFLRSLYYSLDFIFGYFIKDRPVSTNIEAIVYDRHYGDMVVDPVRFGIAGNRFLLAICHLVPKPDILVLLHATPEIARTRKGEITDEKVSLLNSEWLRLGPRLGKKFHVFDASLPVSEITSQLTDLYIQSLKSKLHFE